MTALILYDLCGADPAHRFSPYCWRARLALAHKGLESETVPWRFTEKDRIAFSGQDKVPVLRHGDRVVSDSWRIAEYLEDTWPDRPSLFGGPGGRALARFVNAWSDAVVNAGLAQLIVADIPALLDPGDRAYFVASREKRFGRPLAEVCAGRETRLEGFRASLHPLRMVLRDGQPFLGGAAPLHADYIAFGGFQWARCVSPLAVLAPDDPLHAWRERVMDLFGGLARRVPAREEAAAAPAA